MRKQDFADLFKYGFFHANRDCIVEFTGDINNVKGNYNFFDDIMAFSNPFESSFTYIVLHYQKTDNNSRIADIGIEDVISIYPLDKEAKILLEEDFGPSISFSDPLWEDGVERLRFHQDLQNSKKGIDNIFRIFNITDKDYNYCKSFLPDNIIEETLNELYAGIRPEGELPVWVYILRYERHFSYPPKSLGFCMDAVHALTNYSQKREFYSIEASNIFKYMDALEYNLSIKDYIDRIYQAPETKNFIRFTESITDKCSVIIAASIYFILFDRYCQGLKYEKNVIDFCKNEWPTDFAVASYLLGLKLGHTKTFKCLYEQVSLPFINKEETRAGKSIEASPANPSEPVDTHVIEAAPGASAHSDPKQQDLFGKDNGYSVLPTLKVKMGKLKQNPKNRHDICSRPKPRMVTSKVEMEKLEKEGWIIID